jgi:hypothetical protein
MTGLDALGEPEGKELQWTPQHARTWQRPTRSLIPKLIVQQPTGIIAGRIAAQLIRRIRIQNKPGQS